jgi:dienelactone hydrolase
MPEDVYVPVPLFEVCMLYVTRALAAGVLLLVAPQLLAASSPRLPRDELLLYRDEAGRTRDVKTIADWERRRGEIVRGMESVMGTLPGAEKRVPLDVRVEEEVDGGTYVRRLISYASEPGCRTTAYLLVPKEVLAGKRKSPAVLCLHGTNNEVGHGTVVGLGQGPDRGYAHELAERGYVTFAPSYPLLAKYQPDLAALGWESGTLKAVWDNIRGLDVLESLPFVEPKFAAIGHSLGGHNSVFTAVFEPRLLAVASSCGLDSFSDYYGGDPQNWAPQRGWCQTRYMPKLTSFQGKLEAIPFDFHEMIGALAPRPVLIIAPQRDDNFRAESVDRVAQAAREAYELHGAAENLRVLHPACAHDFPREMREAAYELIDAVLLGEPE